MIIQWRGHPENTGNATFIVSTKASPHEHMTVSTKYTMWHAGWRGVRPELLGVALCALLRQVCFSAQALQVRAGATHLWVLCVLRVFWFFVAPPDSEARPRSSNLQP